MEHLKIPLNEKEETILALMTRIIRLEAENEKLKCTINQLKEHYNLYEDDGK